MHPLTTLLVIVFFVQLILLSNTINGIPVSDWLNNTVKKPAHDSRLFRTIVLENDLPVLLIHDNETERAAASLSVAVGSRNDPKDM
jgi:insulysin